MLKRRYMVVSTSQCGDKDKNFPDTRGRVEVWSSALYEKSSTFVPLRCGWLLLPCVDVVSPVSFFQSLLLVFTIY